MPCYSLGCWDLKGPDRLWQLIVLGFSELLGTSILLFVGCSATLPDENGVNPPLLYRAIAFAACVNISVMGLGHISGGYVNPAISTAALVMGKLSPITYLVYVLSECFGAVLGMQCVLAVTSGNFSAEICQTRLNPNISPLYGAVIECILTSVLTLIVCSSWDPRNSSKTDSAPIKLWGGITALIIAGAKYTGSSMNPARSLAPTILSGNWKNQWIYIVGPIAGGLLMSTIYRNVFYKYNLESRQKEDNEEVMSELLTKNNTIVLETFSKDCYVKTT